MRRYVVRYLLVITTISALLYAVLMNVYLYQGVVGEAYYDMELAAALYGKKYEKDPNTPFPDLWLTKGYLGLSNLPRIYTQIFPAEEYGDKEHFMSGATINGEDVFVQLVCRRLSDGKLFFLVKTYGREHKDMVDSPDLEFLFFLAFPIGILFVLVMFLAVRYMLKHLYGPVGKLNHWARELSPETLNQDLPDFGFKEVNQLAAQLHASLSGLSRALEREQRFLRNASHELRTPVAVIQSNVELLDRVQPRVSSAEEKVRNRIRRSGHSMSHLIETLLWLAKEEVKKPETADLALDELIREVMADNEYLLAGKSGVRVETDLSAIRIHAVPHAVRMAVGNLVRNAFQYTQEGEIRLGIEDGAFWVENVDCGPGGADLFSSDYGHGIGLSLVGQIAEKAGWEYENTPIAGGRRARLVFSPGG